MNNGRNDVFEGDFAAFLSELKKRIGTAAFSSWMHDLRLEARVEEEVTVSTSSEFKRMMIAQRYLSPMRDCWRDAVGEPRKFDLVARRGELSSGAARVKALAPGAQGSPSAAPSVNFQQGGRPATERAGRGSPTLAELASPVDERSTFDRFAVDDSNRLAHAAARQMLTAGSPRDIVYIYGPSGVGKTHLLHAIANAWGAAQLSGHCAYLTYSNLKSGCVDAVFTNGLLALHRDLAAQAVVLIDDIHLLSSSVRTQMEILNLMNVSHAGGCRIAIAGEAAPAELARKGMNERLADRLAGGLAVAIQPGGESLRRDVLRKRAPDLGCRVKDEAIDFIAHNFTKSMREAIGALLQLNLQFPDSEAVVGANEAADALRDRLGDASKRRPTLDSVIEAAAAAFGISQEEILGRSQKQKFVRARHGYVLIAREFLKESYPRIGAAMGRDHTTAMSSYERATALLTRCPRFQAAVGSVKGQLGLC